MQIEIVKNKFLELNNISYMLGHLEKFSINNISGSKAICSIDINLSYKDINDQECFKSLPFDFDIDLEELKINNVSLKDTKIYIIERKGINIDYVLSVDYENDKEIEVVNINDDNFKEEIIEEIEDEIEDYIEKKGNITPEAKEQIISKVKEEISKEYEEKLKEEMLERNDIAIIQTKTSANELDFLSFFDNSLSTKYKIKTIKCDTINDLNEISKQYNIPYKELLYGYDKENGRVVFKYKE
ncbi:MAG: hypothetical protein IJA65_01995 [Acholeplasmatales bacterium]|nr:hypothetical protein [Acholeplasmatales bacterium]